MPHHPDNFRAVNLLAFQDAAFCVAFRICFFMWRRQGGKSYTIASKAIDRMIDEDVPCEDVLSQINAAKSALHGCGKVVLEGHIKHCVRDGIEHGDADKTIENFTKAVERFSNMG